MSRGSSRRGGCLSVLVRTVVILAILLVVVDRVADYAAERITGDQLQSSQNLPTTPTVHIDGFPFLTQFSSGRYQKVSVDATDVPVDGGSQALRLSRLNVVFERATATRSFRTFSARSATATARIGYAALSRRIGITLRYAGNGRVKASKKLSILGLTVTPTISAKPEILNGALSFTRLSVNGLTTAQRSSAQALSSLFGSIPLKTLPFDITVRSLSVGKQGLDLTLTGKDLRYTR